MMRWRSAFLLVAPLLAGAGCHLPSGSQEGVQIRVANESELAFDQVIVASGSPAVEFGALPAGAVSAYRSFERAYRYGYVEVHMGGESRIQQPFDYVGETPLAPGRYTYVLGIDPEHDQLTQTLRVDP